MRIASLAAAAFALAFLASCDIPAEPPAGKRPSRLESQLARREKGIEAGREKLRQAAKDAGPKAKDLPGPIEEAAGVERTKAEIQRIRDAVAKVAVTEEDAAGLSAYCSGDHAEARKQFTASEARRSGREFPAYFLGAIALQDQDHARAKDFFAKAAARNPQCRSAVLLRRLAALCQGRGELGAAQLLLLFEQACREAAKELALDKAAQAPSPANAIAPALASDPVLFKAQELLGEIARRQFWELADAFGDAKTPDEKLGVLLLMGDNVLTDTLIQGLAEEFRTDREIQAFAFLHRHFARSRPAAVLAADLTGITALDKDNGALLLLTIPVPGAEGHAAPLTDDEVALLNKAARAKEFRTYAAYRRAQRIKGCLAAYGALLPGAPMTRVPSIYGHVAGVTRRAAASVRGLLEGGKLEEALRLVSDVEAVAGRCWDEAKNARAQLLQDAIVDALYEAIQAHATKAGLKPLVASCVERRAAVCRHKADRLVAWDIGLLTLFRMPVRRLVEAATEAEDSPALIREFAALKLKADPDRYYKQATDLLAAVADDQVPDGAYEQAVILADLRNRNAVPRLIALAGHPDRLLAHLATRAFTAIAEGKE